MAGDLKVSKEAFESAVIFSLKSLNKLDLKLKTKQQKALEQPITNQIEMDFTKCMSRPCKQRRGTRWERGYKNPLKYKSIFLSFY